ncbi:MAG: D-alanyl-D-alanine carboxypeptidase [Balneolaceae bacterium]
MTSKHNKRFPVCELFSIALAVIVLQSCATTEPVAPSPGPGESDLSVMMDTSSVFSKSITGLMLYDPESDSTLYAFRERNFLTPASNTKLYTFYAGMKMLPEQVPSLMYEIRGDSLIFWGTGDPSFLHPDHPDSAAYQFLKDRSETLYYSDAHYRDESLGSGWAWDDYNSYYSAEKSPFPIYGNVMRYEVERIRQEKIRFSGDKPDIEPAPLRNMIIEEESNGDEPLLIRHRTANEYYYTPKADTVRFEVKFPIHYTPELITELLADTLGREVHYLDEPLPENPQWLYNASRDSLMKHMLQPSDNLIAEQMLLMISSTLEGQPFSTRSAIDYVKENFFEFLPDEPSWVDGSGLSRYNLFTPRSTVALLTELYLEHDSHLLFSLLPAGGESGTIRNWYAHPEGGAPFVFAKTGTLRHNHALSGYLVTRSGRNLIFSFVHNNYTISVNDIRREMEKFLLHIHENY